MTEYRVIVTDEVQRLAGHDGVSYQSLPQPREHALALARALIGTRAAPGRARTVAPGPARRHPHRPNRARAMTTTAPPKTATDAQALDSYLRMLAGPAPGARLLEIRFALRHRDMGRLFIAAHSAPGASRLIRRLAARTDVYVGVCLRTRRAGGRDAIDRSHLAFVEIDTPDALDRLRAFQHPPSMIVSSGSAGHAHAYFTLSAPVTVPELERANRRLAHALGGDLASVDAARILRPPVVLEPQALAARTGRADRTRPRRDGTTSTSSSTDSTTRPASRPSTRRHPAEPAAPRSTGCSWRSQPPNTCTRSPASPPTAPARSTARSTKTAHQASSSTRTARGTATAPATPVDPSSTSRRASGRPGPRGRNSCDCALDSPPSSASADPPGRAITWR